MNKYSKELEIDEQKNLDGLANIKKRIDDIAKRNATKSTKSKYSVDELKSFLKSDLKTYFKVKDELLNKSIKELEIDFNKSINNYLKSGKKLGDLGKLPDDAKEISRAIAAKRFEEFALANNYKVTSDQLADIIKKRIDDSNIKAKKIEDTFLKKGTPAPAPAPAPSGGNTLGEKITNALYKAGKLKKGVRIVKYVLIAGGVGLAGFGVWALLSDGSKFKLGDKYSEEVKKLLNPCLLPLLSNGGTIEPVADGARLILKKTGNSEADSKGGVVYYPNGRAHTMDQSKKGTWSCSEIVKETMKPGTLKEAIRFRLKNLLNEQVDYDISIDGVNIKWDKSTSDSSPTQPKQQMRYTPCSTFPYRYGCKSEDIRKIQEKLEFEDRYITGNFGPITKSKLEALGYDLSNGITKEIYNQIMGTDSKSQPSSGEEKQTQNTIPYSNPDSSFQNKVVSRAFNDLNVKKDTIGTTQTPAQTAPTQPSNEVRNYIMGRVKNNLFNKILNNLVYKGRSLNTYELEFLKNYIKENYGDGYDMTKIKDNLDKNKERIVFKK
jgi:hypothetical protein